MERNGNVNVNEASKGSNYNVNVERQKRLQALNNAKHLQEKFGPAADNSLGFFRKCFNCMSEDKVWSLYEAATRPNASIKNPLAYFIGAAKAQPEMCGSSQKKFDYYRKRFKNVCKT